MSQFAKHYGVIWIVFVFLVSIGTFGFSVLGAAGGKWVFHKQFSDYIVKGYELNEFTSVIIFGICGLVYSLIDGFLAKKVAWVKRESH